MKNTAFNIYLLSATTIIACAIPAIGYADKKWEGGLNLQIMTGIDGPSNDIISIGLEGKRMLRNRWFISFNLDHNPKSDFERPGRKLNLLPTTVNDAPYDSTMLSVYGGKEYGSRSRKLNWFWATGLGINSIGSVDNASGALQGGGTYNIVTKADTETIVSLKGGMKHKLSNDWAMNYTLKIDRHLADWKVRDTVSGLTTTLGDYTTIGVTVGVSRKF